MDEAFVNNYAELAGRLAQAPRFSHESRGIEFYTFPLETRRLSGASDTLNVILRRDMVSPPLEEGVPVRVTGELRSFNNKSGTGNRLILTVFTRSIDLWDGPDENSITLAGAICKPPVLRSTPMGREICDILLAVGRRYHRSDYIPVIAWGLQARDAAMADVGDRLTVRGRLQSRSYTKVIDGECFERLAYEVSASDIVLA